MILAHRGLGEPANTMMAFRRAAKRGFGIEFDVWLTGDEKLVVFHDPILHVDGETYFIKDLSLRGIRSLHPHGPFLVTVEELFASFPETFFNVDVKDVDAVSPLLEVVRRFDAFDRVVFSATEEEILGKLRRESPNARLAFSIIEEKSILLFPVLKRRLNIHALHVPVDGISRVGLPTFKFLLGWARSMGLMIGIWSYEEDEAEYLPFLAGCYDYVISNKPLSIRKIMEKMHPKSM